MNTLARIDDWIDRRVLTRQHQPLIGRIFLVLLVAGIVADIVLVYFLNTQSISQRVWAAETSHSILLVAVAMFGIVGGYLLRTAWWWEIVIWGVLIGHFVTTP